MPPSCLLDAQIPLKQPSCRIRHRKGITRKLGLVVDKTWHRSAAGPLPRDPALRLGGGNFAGLFRGPRVAPVTTLGPWGFLGAWFHSDLLVQAETLGLRRFLRAGVSRGGPPVNRHRVFGPACIIQSFQTQFEGSRSASPGCRKEVSSLPCQRVKSAACKCLGCKQSMRCCLLHGNI